jgi:hypothetical protein
MVFIRFEVMANKGVLNHTGPTKEPFYMKAEIGQFIIIYEITAFRTDWGRITISKYGLAECSLRCDIGCPFIS